VAEPSVLSSTHGTAVSGGRAYHEVMTLRRLAAASLPGLLLLAAACERGAPPAAEQADPGPAGGVRPELVEHSRLFERGVVTVTAGVHSAVGFGLANAILVEGEGCAFVVDVLASVEAAREARAALAGVSDLPIEALVYTHNHADHVFGGRGFAPDGDVEVYAHATTNDHIDRVVSVLRPVISRRADRMFGTLLPETGPDRRENCGIGPFLEAAGGGGTPGLLRPRRTFEDVLETRICGVRVRMEHAPGETDDQILVWLPERGVLLPGDNIYQAFPNLYTIRGTRYRDPMPWVRSLDRMRELAPEHLVPSHGRPVSGRQQIAAILTAYRDGIQFVHDQTLRHINRGLSPDEVVEAVELPPHLAAHPWLQERYGRVSWSVRSIFGGTLGWFGGDTETLSPAPLDERARGYVELAGGREGLRAAAERALEEERLAWAAELAGHWVRAEPESGEARRLKARALRALARRSANANGRNYRLTRALELEGAVEVEDRVPQEGVRDFLTSVPIQRFLAAMPVNLDAEAAADVEASMSFRFPDVDETWTLRVRRGVAVLRPGAPEEPDHAITADAADWIEILAGLRGLPAAVASGDVTVEGGITAVPGVVRFLALFR